MTNIEQIDCEILEKEFSLKTQMLVALGRDKRLPLSGDQQVLLKAKYDDLLAECKALEEKVKKCRATWTETLFEIDFDKAESELKPAFECLRDQSPILFFLLNECNAMMGDYCIQRLEKIWLKNVNRPVNSVIIELDLVDEDSFTEELKKWINKESRDVDLTDSISCFRELCVNHASGLLLIKVRFSYDLNHSEEGIFRTLIDNHFRHINQILANDCCEFGPDQVVILLISDNSVPENHLSDKTTFCTPAEFDPGKILIIPTEQWNAQIVRHWLETKSGIKKISKPDRPKIVELIMSEAKSDLPKKVDTALRRVITDHLSSTEQESQG